MHPCLKNLKTGDEIYCTDFYGDAYSYVVVKCSPLTLKVIEPEKTAGKIWEFEDTSLGTGTVSVVRILKEHECTPV